MNKVSVIMGAYNAKNIIDKAIESILDQSYSNWELIICDDCSEDGTYDYLVEKYKGNSNVKIIKNKSNKKLAFSLNQCLKVATGEYIARMDADDISLPNRLEKQVKFLDEHNDIDVVGGAALVFDGETTSEIRKCPEFPTTSDIIKNVPFIHPTIMMRKKMYDKLNGYTVLHRTERGQDLDLWFRFFSIQGRGYNFQEPLIKYHESLHDFKRRTLKTAKMYMETRVWGYRLLGINPILYIYAFKPIVSALIPAPIMRILHHYKK